MLPSIMISYSGECDSNRGGSEITKREMVIMVVEICVGESVCCSMMLIVAANDIMVCAIRY